MGYLQDGKWVDQWYDTQKTQGRFQRTQATFRHWITRNPKDRFPAEAKRYHLYVSYACPWAHRTLIYRAIKVWKTSLMSQWLIGTWAHKAGHSPPLSQ